MPHRSSGGRGRSSSRSSHRAACATASNTPKPAAAAPPHTVPAQGQSGSERGSLGATFVNGLALGTGTYIAYRAVDALMGPPVIKQETVCADQSKAFIDCLEGYGSDISKCQGYMDLLRRCRQTHAH
ncbi:hypothetical protein CFP56_017018 [Quercus suber]|uniref:CHCH domain-containing protein n=1 Tax=Quercus suber TaxID=58331 RepID=A0AAW0KNA0_QUESU|nr:hemiasterlin resistant protein 1-like [Quercus suber]